jgi:hypothetical protein
MIAALTAVPVFGSRRACRSTPKTTYMPDVLLGQLQQLVGELHEGFQRLELLVEA